MSLSRLDVWPSLSPHVYARRSAKELPFPLQEPGCALFERGRHALWHGLRQLGLGAGAELLVPAYHHGSEVEALARAGLRRVFYETQDDLAPDADELRRLLTPDTRALYLIHYLGFPQDAPRWRRWCDERGLLLIEDAAQAWLASLGGRPLGSFGDLAIFCLYKTIGLPDGGALLLKEGAVTNSVAGASAGRPPAGVIRLTRRHAAWLRQRLPHLAALSSNHARRTPYSPEADFALGDPVSRPSATTQFLLPRVDPAAAADLRRLNYRLLLEHLRDLTPPAFDELPEGASPFAFPILTEDKPKLLGRLANDGVRALDLWSRPHPSLPADRFPRAASLRASTVGLPVHQELAPRDVERVARAVRPGRTAGSRLALEPLDSLEAAREPWSELAARSRSVFATWEWAMTWWRHFGTGHQLLTTACRSADGRLMAILPLYLWQSRPLRVVRFVGHGPADELGPICAGSDRRIAARLLRRLLRERRREFDLFLGEQLPASEHWDRLLGAHAVHGESSPLLRSTGDWKQYLASRSRNLRQQVRRRERALAREHELRYRLADDPARLEADMDTLLALHTQGWSERQSPFAGAHQAFHREFAAQALQRGWLRLWFLELDGRPCAAWYGFRFEGIESYYQAGRDRAWDHASVGFVLLAHSIRAALDDGIREYRFLRGGESYKYRFADADPGLQTLAVAHGVRGAAGLAALGAKAAQVATRRRLEA